MTDRLAELKKGTMSSDEEYPGFVEIDLDYDVEPRETSADSMSAFHGDIDDIETVLSRFKDNNDMMEGENDRYKDDDLGTEEREEAANRMAALVASTGNLSKTLRDKLRTLARENETYAAQNDQKPAAIKIRINRHQALTQEFIKALKTFQAMQDKHRRVAGEAYERQLRKMNPQASEEEIREAVYGGTANRVVGVGNSPLMTQLSLSEQQRLRDELGMVVARNQAIKALEKNIVELHQMFVDMQLLVESQGEVLNNVECNLVETREQAATGVEDLVHASDYRRRANKKKMCIAILVFMISLAILVPVLVVYIPKWISGTAETTSNRPSTENVVESSTFSLVSSPAARSTNKNARLTTLARPSIDAVAAVNASTVLDGRAGALSPGAATVARRSRVAATLAIDASTVLKGRTDTGLVGPSRSDMGREKLGDCYVW